MNVLSLETKERINNKEDSVDNFSFNYKPKPVYAFFKRLFDIIVSSIVLIILLVPFAVISIIILIDDKNAPPIFVQKRVGKNGKLFNIYKFRTMCANAEEKLSELEKLNEMDGPVFKIKDDPRITKVGKFLRTYNIDELPQMLNVFLGNMSFVGPRPPLPKEVAQYRETDKLRLLVTPGITCYWQVTKNRNDVSFDEWMKMDRQYIMDRNAFVDIKLIFKTFLFLFKRSGC